MAGVTSLTATRFRGDYYAGLDTGATLVASWIDGRPLEAINADRDVIDITLYPNVIGDDNATGDYKQLFANALAFTPADTVTTVSTPEPASMALLAVGAAGVGLVGRKRVLSPKA